MAILKKLDIKLLSDLAVLLLGTTPKTTESMNLNRYQCTHIHSIIHNGQKLETAYLCIDWTGWIGKQNVVSTYIGILVS